MFQPKDWASEPPPDYENDDKDKETGHSGQGKFSYTPNQEVCTVQPQTNYSYGIPNQVLDENHIQTFHDPELPTFVQGPFKGVFSKKSIRIGFTRKVLGILLFQLAVTFAIGSIFIFYETVRENVRGMKISSPYIIVVILLVVIDIAVAIFAAAKRDLVKRTVVSYTLILLATICSGIPLGTLAAYVEKNTPFYIVTAMTLAMILSTIIFTLQSKWELNYLNGLGISALSIALVGGIYYFASSQEVKDDNLGIYIGVAAFVVLLIGIIWLAVLTAIIRHSRKKLDGGGISPEDFAVAALLLYLTIVLILAFILLMFLGEGRGSNVRCSGVWFCHPVGCWRSWDDEPGDDEEDS